MSHGKGSYVWTVDGTKLLDFTGGASHGVWSRHCNCTNATAIGVLSTGYCHPKVVAAVQQQVGQLIHAGQNIFAASPPLVRCACVATTDLHC